MQIKEHIHFIGVLEKAVGILMEEEKVKVKGEKRIRQTAKEMVVRKDEERRKVLEEATEEDVQDIDVRQLSITERKTLAGKIERRSRDPGQIYIHTLAGNIYTSAIQVFSKDERLTGTAITEHLNQVKKANKLHSKLYLRTCPFR
jgi:hypothetical protein